MDGKKLKGAMVSRGVTQQALAKALGMSASHLSNCITGKADFKLYHVRAIREQLALTPEEVDAIFMS